MPLEELKSAGNRTVGTKQTIKFINKGHVKEVFVAADADKEVIKPIIEICQKKSIPFHMIATKKELGKACGIEVGCASAAIVD